MFSLAVALPFNTWAKTTAELMAAPSLPRPVPEITTLPLANDRARLRAQGDKAFRKLLLRRYRLDVVRPILLEFDVLQLRASAAAVIPVLGVPFSALQPT